jgi:hypothetical protein
MNTNDLTQKKKNQPSQPQSPSFDQPGPSNPSSSAVPNRLTAADVLRNDNANGGRHKSTVASKGDPSPSFVGKPKATFTLPSTDKSENAKHNVITSFTSAVIATSTAHNWAASHRSQSIVSLASDQQPIRITEMSLYTDRLDYDYQPGDCVSGKMHLVLESGQLCTRRLLVTLRGIASVRYVMPAKRLIVIVTSTGFLFPCHDPFLQIHRARIQKFVSKRATF